MALHFSQLLCLTLIVFAVCSYGFKGEDDAFHSTEGHGAVLITAADSASLLAGSAAELATVHAHDAAAQKDAEIAAEHINELCKQTQRSPKPYLQRLCQLEKDWNMEGSGTKSKSKLWVEGLQAVARDASLKDPYYIENDVSPEKSLPISRLRPQEKEDVFFNMYPMFPAPVLYPSVPNGEYPLHGVHAEEVIHPIYSEPRTNMEKMRVVALVEYSIESQRERNSRRSMNGPADSSTHGIDVSKFFFGQCDFADCTYTPSELDVNSKEAIRKLVEMQPPGIDQATQDATMFVGADRKVKGTLNFPFPDALKFFKEADAKGDDKYRGFRGAFVNAWRLQDKNPVQVDFSTFKLGNMFDLKWNTDGRAAEGSKLLLAHGTDPNSIQKIIREGFYTDTKRNTFNKDETSGMEEQFLTLGKAAFFSTQLQKFSQYAPPLHAAWTLPKEEDGHNILEIDSDQYREILKEATDRKEGGTFDIKAALDSNIRKASSFFLVVQVDVEDAFVLPAGLADLQGAKAPMRAWMDVYSRAQEELVTIRSGVESKI